MNAGGLGAVNLKTAYACAIEPQAADFDELGHINNAVYVRWAQEMATRHWTAVAPPEMRQAYIFVVLRHEIDCRDPTLPGDPVVARTWLGRAAGPRFDRYVDIRKPDARRASASFLTTWVMIDAETRRPRRVGEDVLQAFQVPG